MQQEGTRQGSKEWQGYVHVVERDRILLKFDQRLVYGIFFIHFI